MHLNEAFQQEIDKMLKANKVIAREPYHFKAPEDIAHLLADACIARKAIGTKSLMKLHPFLQLLTLSMGDLDIL